MSFPHADRSLLVWYNHITQDVQLVCGDGGGVCQIWLHRNELFTSAPAPVSFFSHCSHCRRFYFILFWSVNSRSENFHESQSRLFLYLVWFGCPRYHTEFRNPQTHQTMQSLNVLSFAYPPSRYDMVK